MNINAVKAYVRVNTGKCCRIAAVVLVLLIALCIHLSDNLTKAGEIVIVGSFDEEPEVILEPVQEKEILIVVDVQGAVESPGVFSLPEGSRVNDAVQKAGGLTENADTMDVNLAAKLKDGDKVYIPKENDVRKAVAAAGIVTDNIASGVSGNSTTGGLVNINTANSDQLQSLTGVGPVTAQKIIEYRETSGEFKKIEDIMKVSGIGAKTFEKFKDKIAV